MMCVKILTASERGGLWWGVWTLLLAVMAMGALCRLAIANDNWRVRDQERRHKVIFERYLHIVENKPERGHAYNRLLKLARTWPGLDQLLLRVRVQVKKHPKHPNFRLLLAHLLYTTRRQEEALKEYQEVLRYAPNMVSGYLYLAALQRELGKLERALDTYRQAYALAQSTADKRRCLKAMATLSMQLKKSGDALKYLRTFLQLNPGDLGIREEMIRALVREKLYTEALAQWDEILKRSSNNAERSRIWREIGLVYEQQGRWMQSVESYRKAMNYTHAKHWLRRELNERILQLHRENGKLDDLVEHLQNKRSKSPDELSIIARLLDELRRNKEAFVAYNQALKANPSDTALRHKYITLLEISNRGDEAIAQYRLLLRHESREPRYQLAFIELLSRLGKQKEVLEELGKTAQVFARNPEVLNRLATIYRNRKMRREAISLYQRLINLEPNVPTHRRMLGNFYHQLGDETNALRVWKALLKSGLPTHEAQSNLGQILRDHGCLAPALEAMRQARKLRPKHIRYEVQLAELYQRILDEQGQLSTQTLKEAAEVWQNIYKRTTQRTLRKQALQQLFAIYHAQGKLYRMPAHYQQKLRYNPKDIEALRWLGEYELWQASRSKYRRSFRAQHYFRQILKYTPNDIDALLTLETLAVRGKQWRQARDLLLQSVRVHSAGRRAYYRRLCDYSLKMNDHQQAIGYAQKAISIDPEDASAHAELARIYRKIGNNKRAVSAYREAIRLRPQSHSYTMSLANLLHTRGQSEQAADLYRQVYKSSKDSRVIYEAALQAIDILMPLGKVALVEGELLRLSEINARELSYFRALAELYKRQGNTNAYRIAYLKAAATVDQKSEVYKQLVEIAQQQGDLPRAIIYFRKMLEENPNPSMQEQLQLAELYFQVKDNGNAHKLLIGLMNENPNSPRVLRQLAEMFDKHDQPNHAIRAYEYFLDHDPQSYQVRMRLAQLYEGQKQYEAAIGLLSGIVWNYHDRIVRKKTTMKRNGKKRKRILPYYLGRPSVSPHFHYHHRMRMRMPNVNQQAMLMLLKLYHQLNRLDEWDRRVLLALSDPNASVFRNYFFHTLGSYYAQNQWYNRLQQTLELMHRRYPRNVDWLRYLAEIYHKQNRYAKALEFYEKIEQIQPYYRNRHFVEKLQLALALEDRERVKHLVDGYLHNKVRWDAQVDRALPLLKRHNRYDIAAKILKWAMRYGYSYRRGQYLERLIAVYLKMDKRKQARILLLNEWHKPSLILPAHASIYSIMQQRQKILEQIWPLLSFKQQEELLQHKKSVLLQKLIESPQKSAFKQTLVDIYILFTISRELSVAQQYIPALWDVMSNAYDDRKLQNDIIQNILKRGEYDIFAQLLEKNLQNYPSPEQKVYFMLYVFQLFSGQQFFPPAKMSDFLENQLQNLRPLVSPLLWQYAALQLTDRYLAWSDYQRAINWLTVCQHAKNPPPHPKYSEHLKSNEVQFIVRLARTYQHKGKDQLANQQYRLATERLWAGFVSDPVSVYYRSLLDKLLQVLMRPNIATNPEYFGHVWSMYEKSIEQLRQSRFQLSGQSKPQYVRRYHSRITQQIAQLQRQHDTALKRAEASILDMYRIYDEAGRREDLLKQLEQFGKNGGGKNNKGGKGNKGDKEQRVYYVIAGYLLDWKQHRTPASLEALVGLLRSVIPHNPLPKSRELYLLLAQLETEAAQYDRAIALYRKLVRDQKPKDSVELWRKIAQIYGQLGREQEQVQTHQRLATQLHDHLSDLWLSHYYLERQNIDQAIRHHQSYLKRQARSQYAQLPLAAQTAVQLSEFLLVSGHTDRVFEFLRRALGELRTAPKGNLYQYSHIMQQIMSIALRIGKLQELVAEWEAQRQQNSGDINLLYQLFFAYRLLDQTPNERVVLEELLKLRPNLHQLLQSLLSIYEAESAYQQAIAFLHKLYDKRPQKPNNYYLLLGKLYAQLGQKQQAFASWQKHFESCSSQQSNYEQFACRVDASKTTLESGGIKEALSMYRRAIENYSNLNHWSLVQAVELLNKHQAYREALDFIAVLRGATWPQSPMIINSLDIQLYIAMIRAYRGVQQQDKARQLIQQLRHSDYRDYTTVQRAAALLEEEGFGLSTERVYWSALQKTKPKTWEQRYVYKNLCAYWQRHNLGRMCVGDVDEQQKLIDKQRSLLLAERFEQAGFPYLALIELRKLRLHLPKDPDIWRKLYRLSLQVGHHKEAKQWLEKLRENNRDTKELEQFRKKHEQIAAKAPARPHLPSRKNWPAVAIPGYCQQLKIKSGRLYTANCYNNTSFNIRCERQLLHIGNKLITNDCMGRLLAIDASSGSVNWIYELPRLKHSYEADQKRKAIITAVSSGQIGRPQSFAQFKQNFVSVRRYYQVVDIAATPDGDVLVTINQNWMDHGHRWASGIHEKLHILRIDPSSGQLRWHRKHDGHFAISPAAINGEAFALYGRFYRVFRLQDGQAMWHRQAGKSREIWLFGEKDQLAHIAYHSGFVVMGWDNYLYHYDRKGKLLWRKRQEAQVYAMAIHKQNLLLRNADGQILAIGLKNGDRQWRMDNTGGVQKREIMISQSYPHAYQMISPLLVQADQFFYSSIDGYVSAHSAIDGQSLWRRKIGDHGPYAPVASTCGTKLAFIGEEGTLSLLTTKSGRLLWQYRFPQQIENTVRRRNYRATNSRIQLDAHQIWLGSYDRLPRFVIQAFWFQTQNLQPLVSRLQQLVEQLQREGRSKLAFHAIVNAIDRYDRYFRTQILHIARQIRLPHRQQWLWAYHYLASGQDLQKDLGQLQAHWQKMPLSLNIRDDIQADTDQSRIAIVQLIALITHPNDFRRKEGLNAWQRICVGETPHLMLALADSLSRRFASAMLQHRDPQVRLLAAFSLMMWGDSEGRQTLLEVFTREENFEQAHNKQLRQLGIRNIIGWDAILYWDGLAMTIDAPIIQKLLKSSNAEIRLRSAIFLAMHSAASSKFRKKYDSPLLRQILRQSSIVLNQELAILAAAYLAQLGEGKGIDQLRVLYTQTTGYHKNRIARILYSVFKDLSGLNTILTSYHGNNRINLQLPSFSLIYGNRLQSLKRYDEALYQYQITSKIPKDKIAPAHSVMALLGMGQCLFFLKRYDLARQKFQQALKLEPMLLDALDFLGRIHFELKEYPQAHKLFTRAIQGNPYNSTLRRFAALTLFLLQQPQAAHQLFTQALKDRPEWHSGHYYYAYTLYLAPQTELPLALTHIEQAIKYAAYNPRFLQLKARILYKLKRQTQAHDTLLDAIQKEAPQSPRRKEYIHLYQQWFKRTPPDRQIQGK